MMGRLPSLAVVLNIGRAPNRRQGANAAPTALNCGGRRGRGECARRPLWEDRLINSPALEHQPMPVKNIRQRSSEPFSYAETRRTSLATKLLAELFLRSLENTSLARTQV